MTKDESAKRGREILKPHPAKNQYRCWLHVMPRLCWHATNALWVGKPECANTCLRGSLYLKWGLKWLAVIDDKMLPQSWREDIVNRLHKKSSLAWRLPRMRRYGRHRSILAALALHWMARDIECLSSQHGHENKSPISILLVRIIV